MSLFSLQSLIAADFPTPHQLFSCLLNLPSVTLLTSGAGGSGVVGVLAVAGVPVPHITLHYITLHYITGVPVPPRPTPAAVLTGLGLTEV